MRVLLVKSQELAFIIARFLNSGEIEGIEKFELSEIYLQQLETSKELAKLMDKFMKENLSCF